RSYMRAYSIIPGVCALALALSAQEFQGTLLGRITDSSGAVVPGVQISLVARETGVASSTKPNAQGNYRIPFLLPGEYRLTIGHPGFQKIERSALQVSAGTETTIDFVLQVSSSAENVTVT